MAAAGRASRWNDARLVSLLTGLILIAASVRFIGAILYGIRTATQSLDGFGLVNSRSGEVLTAFGSSGDVVQALLALIAGGLVGWALRSGLRVVEGLRFAALAVAVLTVVSALLSGIGFIVLVHHNFNDAWGQLSIQEAQSVASIVLAGGALAVINAFEQASERAVTSEDGFDAVVFAVDRGNGNVRVFFSLDEVGRRLHVYSIEDDEYELFADEGEELRVALDDDGRMVFTRTGIQRRADLLERLKEFSLRRGVPVDPADADEPAAYAIPVSDWQWLELWPPWMRWMGRIFRRA